MNSVHAPGTTVAGLLLAAGGARRMGENKLLLTWRDAPIARHAAAALVASRARPIVVVLGHDAHAVRAALAGLPVRFTLNDRWMHGQSASLHAGLAALPNAPAVVITLADQPAVPAALIDALIERWRRDQPVAVRASYDGLAGMPTLLDRRLFTDMARLEGDHGARGLLGQLGAAVAIVEWPSGPERDVDTPAQWAAWRQEHGP